MRRFLPLVFLASAFGQSTTAVIPPQFFGLHWYYNNPYPVVPFGSMRLWDTNATRWQVMNPNTFTNLDNVLSTAKTNGYPTDIMLSLGATPKSISSDPTNSVCAYSSTATGSCGVPTDIASSCTNVNTLNNCDGKTDGTNQTWRTYIYNLATHLAGLSSATYQPVTSIEIWNEFTSQSGAIFGQWEGTAQQMVRMYQDANCIFTGRGTITSQGGATCTAGHLGVPTVGIIPSMVVTTPNSVMAVSGASALFGTYLGTTGALNSVDAVAAHTYTGSPFPTAPEKVATFFTTLNGYLVSASSSCATITLGCWSTEGSWGNNSPNEPDPDMQAAYIARYYFVGWASGWQRMYEYAYTANNVGTLWVANGSSGCVLTNGCLTKAGTAYQTTYRWMVGQAMPTLCSNVSGTTWTCRLGNAASSSLIVWDTSQTCSGGSCGTVSYTIPAATYVSYSSLDGSTTTLSPLATTVQVGAKPIRLNVCTNGLCSITTNTALDVLAAPSLGGLVSNGALVTDTMVANNTVFRATDTTTQIGANHNFTYNVPCGGSADNNIMSKNGTFVLVEDSGANYFIRYIVPNVGTLPTYPNFFSGAQGNLSTNCGEFSYNNDLLFYDHGSTVGTQIIQYNLAGYNVPSITAPASLPTQTLIADFGPVIGGSATWQTLGGMDRNDNVNGVSFNLVQAYSTSGGQNHGCIAADAVANAVTPVTTNNLYFVYNTCTGAVAEWTWNGSSWVSASVGTVSIDDRFCIHNIKYHGGSYATITGNTVPSNCPAAVTGNGAQYYFWQLRTATVIPCIACTGHETEYIASFIGALNASGDGNNFGQTTYSTAGAGLVNTSGTAMTFVSGIAPSSSMNGQKIAVNGVAYTASGCTSSGCTLSGSAGTQTGVRYYYPVNASINGGFYGMPQLINFPSLWSLPNCTGGSYPYSNTPCAAGSNDSHLSSNGNPGNDTGLVVYSTTTIGNTSFPRSIGIVSTSGNTVTLLYGGSFAPFWNSHNLIIAGANYTITGYISSSQVTVSPAPPALTAVPYYFETYTGGGYDELDAVVGGGTNPAPGYLYRLLYTYNTTLNPGFYTQQAIASVAPTGTIALSTDWQCGFGTTDGTASNGCAPDWQASANVLTGAFLWPQTNNNGKYVYTAGGNCQMGLANPNPWNQAIGGTQSDGTCTWTNHGTYRGDIVLVNLGSAPSITPTGLTVTLGVTITSGIAIH